MSRSTEVYTIGHSTCSFDEILALLKAYGIQMILDIRSRPHVSFFPEFSKTRMKMRLVREGIVYIFMGQNLGRAPLDPRGRTRSGQPDPVAWECSEPFHDGIHWIVDHARYSRICLFCGEGDPHQCHRHYLVGQNLLSHGVRVRHILLTGAVEDAQADLYHHGTPGGCSGCGSLPAAPPG